MKHEILADGIEIYQGDCLDILPTLGKIDAVVTDPPYNFTGIEGGGYGKRKMYSNGKIDHMMNFDVSEFLTKSKNVITPANGFYFCSRLGIEKYLRFAADMELNYDVLVWYKPNAIPFTNGTLKSDFEYIIRIYGQGAKITKGYKQHEYSKLFIENIDPSQGKEHPTKKPLPIMMRLVKLISQPAQMILDPYMGSASTGVACIQLQRKFIGIELDPKYYEIAKRRICEELARPRFDFDVPASLPEKQEVLI